MALGLGFLSAYSISKFSAATLDLARGGPSEAELPLAPVLIAILFAVAVLAAIAGAMLYAPGLPWSGARISADGASKNNNVILQTGALLNVELGKVLGIIRSRMGTDESYAVSLANAQARLADLPTPEQVRVIVGLLVAENHRMRLDSTKMTTQLNASRLQIEGLRLRLERAHEVGLQDPLTEVGNRRCFDAVLTSAISAAQSNSSHLSIVIGDLDRFKSINDQYGHPVGDEVLKFFTQLMIASVRDGDTVARLGGEEFVIVLPQCGGAEASAIAERIRSKLSAKSLTIRRSSQDIGLVTASFGVAEFRSGEQADQFVARADGALYSAKNTGRNRVAIA